MAKCITLVRVSTKKQDYDEQSQQVYQMAIKDGYKDNEIIQIEEKESGYLNEDDRRGLLRMKQCIEEDNTINCVYSWEVSRVARRKKVGFSVLDYLSNKKIDLRIFTPRLYLLNEDGSINEGMEMAFMVALQAAEAEYRNIKARAFRSAIKRKKEGKITNNKPKYGYKMVNGYAVIDEEQAEFVKMIFDLYYNRVPTKEIARKITALGKTIDAIRVTRYIHFPYYGTDVYPQIISKDIWDECQRITEEKTLFKNRDSHRIYFGRSILRCPYCNNVLNPNAVNGGYKCETTNCKKTKLVSINAVDSCIWHVAKILYAAKSLETEQLTEQKYQEKRNELLSLIKKYQSKINNYYSRKDKLEEDFYVFGNISEAKMVDLTEKINEQISMCQKEVDTYNNMVYNLDTMYHNQKRQSYNSSDLDNLEDNEKQMIILDMIEKVYVYKENKANYRLDVFPKMYTDKVSFNINMYAKRITSNDIAMNTFILYERYVSSRLTKRREEKAKKLNSKA